MKGHDAHQNSLVQHLTPLHVRGLDVDAVGPTLPAGEQTTAYELRRRDQGRGGTCGSRAGFYSHLHISETLDAKQRLVLSGEQDVGLLVESCGHRGVFKAQLSENKRGLADFPSSFMQRYT